MNYTRAIDLKHLRIIPPFLISLVAFGIICFTAEHLPVLGDGAIHAYITKEIATEGTLAIDADVYYPLFYHVSGAIAYLFMGISGLKLLSPLMMTLSGLVVYLIAKEMTKSEIIGLSSIFLIALSPIVLRNGAEIIMEPFVVFFVLLAIYAALLFYKEQNLKTAIFAVFITAIAISTKQQALFLILVLPIFFLASKINVKIILLFLVLVVLIASGPYIHLWSSGYGLIPLYDSEIIHLRESDSILDKIKLKFARQDIPEWSVQLEQESNAYETYTQDTNIHALRYNQIWDMTNLIIFAQSNSLYPYDSVDYCLQNSRFLCFTGFIFLQILLFLGFIFSLAYSKRNSKWRVVPIIVATSWLFSLGGGYNITRYLLYLAVFLAFIYLLPVKFIYRKLSKMKRPKIITLCLAILGFISLFYLIQAQIGEQKYVTDLETKQCYTPSEGGIPSIEEVGLWINKHTEEADKIFGTSSEEWRYYSDRECLWEYRIYFLPIDRVDYYMKLWDIKYVMVRQNQLLKDRDWDHVEFYPQSFYNNIKENYSLVYTSSYDDIEVYEVQSQ